MNRWHRTSVTDEYAEAGAGVVLLEDGRVLALSALAWAAVESLAPGEMSELEVAAFLVRRFGVPRDVSGRELTVELTSEVLRDLAEQGVVAQVAGTEGP